MTFVVGVLLALLALSSTVGAGLELELARVRWDVLRIPLAAALVANLTRELFQTEVSAS